MECIALLFLGFRKEPVAKDFSFFEEGCGDAEVSSEKVKVGAFSFDPVSENGGEFMAGVAEGGKVVALHFVFWGVIRPGPVMPFYGSSQAA